jgi:lysophospholipase L1-like esterase
LANPQPIVDFILRSIGMHTSFTTVPSPGSEYRFGNNTDWWDNFNDIQTTLDSIGNVNILFMGNSITQAIGKRRLEPKGAGEKVFDSIFTGYKYAVAGIRGDKTQNLLWRIQNTDFSKANPQFVVVTIGVNNFAEDEPTEITAGIQAIINALKNKSPMSKILLVGPLPAGNSASDDYRTKYNEVHKQIKSFIDKKKVWLCDPSSLLIDENTGKLTTGLYSKDGIHLVENGYRVWATEMYKIIQPILK